mmetsp:Transcript_50102/g.117072  ORF Transcript_50102/g.117072 Transcript_50102/m.117072 type:complete len:577 (+) Transcript_50102:3-1733(+)
MASQAARLFPRDAEIVGLGFEALRLAMQAAEGRRKAHPEDRSTASRILDMDFMLSVLPSVELVRIGEGHRTDTRVVSPVCELIRMLASQGVKSRCDLIAAGAVAVPLHAMDAGALDASTASSAAMAVRQLCFRQQEAQRHVAGLHGIELLYNALQDHAESAVAVRSILAALAVVAKDPASRRQLVRPEEPATLAVLDKLIRISQSTADQDPDILAQLCLTLGALTEDPQEPVNQEFMQRSMTTFAWCDAHANMEFTPHGRLAERILSVKEGALLLDIPNPGAPGPGQQARSGLALGQDSAGAEGGLASFFGLGANTGQPKRTKEAGRRARPAVAAEGDDDGNDLLGAGFSMFTSVFGGAEAEPEPAPRRRPSGSGRAPSRLGPDGGGAAGLDVDIQESLDLALEAPDGKKEGKPRKRPEGAFEEAKTEEGGKKKKKKKKTEELEPQYEDYQDPGVFDDTVASALDLAGAGGPRPTKSQPPEAPGKSRPLEAHRHPSGTPGAHPASGASHAPQQVPAKAIPSKAVKASLPKAPPPKAAHASVPPKAAHPHPVGHPAKGKGPAPPPPKAPLGKAAVHF